MPDNLEFKVEVGEDGSTILSATPSPTPDHTIGTLSQEGQAGLLHFLSAVQTDLQFELDRISSKLDTSTASLLCASTLRQ